MMSSPTDGTKRAAARSTNGPLMLAVTNTDVDTVAWLIDRVAQINAVTNEGWTPLMYAASAGNEAIVKLLIGRGAEINVRDTEGETALSIARQHKYDAIVALLQNAINVIGAETIKRQYKKSI